MAATGLVFLTLFTCFPCQLSSHFAHDSSDSFQKGVQYCWAHASDSPTQSGPSNQTCQTKDTHIPNLMSETNNSTNNSSESTAGQPETNNSTDNSSGSTGGQPANHNATGVTVNVTRCYMFTTDTTMYVPGTENPDKNVTAAVNDSAITTRHILTRYGCDYGDMCKDAPLGKNTMYTNRTVDGRNVTLHCCDRNNCNKPALNFPPPSCYHLYPAHNNTLKGCIKKCRSWDSSCTRDTLYTNLGVTRMYQCDGGHRNQLQCNQLNLKGKDLVCKNITSGDMVREVCCCNGNTCVKPSSDEVIEQVDQLDCSRIMNYTQPFKPIEGNKNIRPTTKKGGKDWLFIGGMISAAVLVVMIIVGVIIIARRIKVKSRENNRLSLSYTRLAADRLPEDDEDVQMLLS